MGLQRSFQTVYIDPMGLKTDPSAAVHRLGRLAACAWLALVIVGSVGSLAGCTFQHKSGESQVVHTSTICVLSLCEGTDKIERIGDPEADGDNVAVQDSETDNAKIKQDEEGSLDLDTGPL